MPKNSKLQELIKKSQRLAEETMQSSAVWISRSKETEDGDWINKRSSVSELKADDSDSWTYNVFHELTKDGVEEFKNFIEEHELTLLPDTGIQTDKGNHMRYMIATRS
tara:strand:+ start:216 stop:539 length:324 start_codon:yes stop_codon:yes gene_type:complete